MTRSARHRGPITPRWVRGLLTGALLAVVSTSGTGCGLSYVFRNISPLHPTGWSFAWPILPSQQQRLEEDMAREERDRVPILDPIPGEFAPGDLPRPAQRGRGLGQGAQVPQRLAPLLRGPAQQRPVPHREDRRHDRPVQGLSRWPAPASSSTATTSAPSTSTSCTGRTTRSRSTTSITASRSSTSTRTTSAAAAARPSRRPPDRQRIPRNGPARPPAAPGPNPGPVGHPHLAHAVRGLSIPPPPRFGRPDACRGGDIPRKIRPMSSRLRRIGFSLLAIVLAGPGPGTRRRAGHASRGREDRDPGTRRRRADRRGNCRARPRPASRSSPRGRDAAPPGAGSRGGLRGAGPRPFVGLPAVPARSGTRPAGLGPARVRDRVDHPPGRWSRRPPDRPASGRGAGVAPACRRGAGASATASRRSRARAGPGSATPRSSTSPGRRASTASACRRGGRR